MVESREGDGVVEEEHAGVHLPFDVVEQVLATGGDIVKYVFIFVQERVCFHANRCCLYKIVSINSRRKSKSIL